MAAPGIWATDDGVNVPNTEIKTTIIAHAGVRAGRRVFVNIPIRLGKMLVPQDRVT